MTQEGNRPTLLDGRSGMAEIAHHMFIESAGGKQDLWHSSEITGYKQQHLLAIHEKLGAGKEACLFEDAVLLWRELQGKGRDVGASSAFSSCVQRWGVRATRLAIRNALEPLAPPVRPNRPLCDGSIPFAMRCASVFRNFASRFSAVRHFYIVVIETAIKK